MFAARGVWILRPTLMDTSRACSLANESKTGGQAGRNMGSVKGKVKGHLLHTAPTTHLSHLGTHQSSQMQLGGRG